MRSPLLAIVAVIVLLVIGCGGGSEPDAAGSDPSGSDGGDGDGGDGDGGDGSGDDLAAGLDGRTFESTAVTVDGIEQPLVDGTVIRLSFENGQLGASAGCNSMGGGYQLDASTLVIGAMAMTEMGCDPARHAQDDLVVGFLAASPSLELAGDELVASTDDTVMRFLDRRAADPDRPIVDTEWEVTGFIDGEVAMSFAEAGAPASLTFDGERSEVAGFDGCATFTIPVEIADGSTGGPVEGDGELQFGSPSVDEIDGDCPPDDEARARLYDALAGEAVYEIDGPNLTITNRNGNGVTLRAR